MRKLGIGTSSYVRTDSPPSRQHTPSLHNAAGVNNERPLEPIPSMITLRDTNIREQAASPSMALHQMRNENCGNYFRGSAAYMGLARDRIERDCSSPYGQYGSLVGGRENSCLLSRDSCVTPMGSHRTPSNRLLSSGIDQRIMKQSTEDCRRLLQQVIYHTRPPIFFPCGILINHFSYLRLQATAVADPGRVQSNSSTAMELGTTPPQQQHMIVPAPPVPPPFRVLTTSNSFDSKSNVPNFSGRFYMSAEATKLFNTLQQSPLPINSEVRPGDYFVSHIASQNSNFSLFLPRFFHIE